MRSVDRVIYSSRMPVRISGQLQSDMRPYGYLNMNALIPNVPDVTGHVVFQFLIETLRTKLRKTIK